MLYWSYSASLGFGGEDIRTSIAHLEESNSHCGIETCVYLEAQLLVAMITASEPLKRKYSSSFILSPSSCFAEKLGLRESHLNKGKSSSGYHKKHSPNYLSLTRPLLPSTQRGKQLHSWGTDARTYLCSGVIQNQHSLSN